MGLNKNRITELDGLRGIAAMFVVLYHFTTRFSEKFDNEILSDIMLFKYGHYGVQMFFVISGFVIFMSINKIISPFEFVYKRFMRLYPTFWICLILTTLFVSFLGLELLKVNWKDFFVNFTMIPHVLNSKFLDGVYWTLQIELCFYLFILLLLLTTTTRYITIIGLFYIVCGFGLYFAFKLFPYYHHGLLFFAGIQFYKLWHGDKKWHAQVSLFAIIVLSFLFKGIELGSCISLIFGIFYLLIYQKLSFLSLPLFIFLGKVSYTFYLLHQNIGHSVQLILIQNNLTNKFLLIAIPFFLTLAMSYLVTHFFEEKVLKKLNTLFYKLRFKNLVTNN